MNFKEQVERDLANVFFNLDEFGEIINLNGIEITGIFQPIKYEPFSINKNDSSSLYQILCKFLNFRIPSQIYLKQASSF